MIGFLNGRMDANAQRRFQRFLYKAQKQAGISGSVDIYFAENDEMKRLNRQFRRKNKPTDVLSFPAADHPGRKKSAGDLAIGVDIARENAARLGHSLEEECKILILHGLLHLAGYDHEQDDGEMARIEAKLRTTLGLPNSLIERTVAR